MISLKLVGIAGATLFGLAIIGHMLPEHKAAPEQTQAVQTDKVRPPMQDGCDLAGAMPDCKAIMAKLIAAQAAHPPEYSGRKPGDPPPKPAKQYDTLPLGSPMTEQDAIRQQKREIEEDYRNVHGFMPPYDPKWDRMIKHANQRTDNLARAVAAGAAAEKKTTPEAAPPAAPGPQSGLHGVDDCALIARVGMDCDVVRKSRALQTQAMTGQPMTARDWHEFLTIETDQANAIRAPYRCELLCDGAKAVAPALSVHHQKKLINPPDCLNQNVRKGFCEKGNDGSLVITPEGLEALEAKAE
jgi:hypothetical protein